MLTIYLGKKLNFRTFCEIILKHIKFSKDISLEWCPIAGFSEAGSISTTGWQSAQYIAFSHLSLVYFGLLEDFKHDLDETKFETFWQVFVLWFLLILSLFLENVPHLDLVDDYGRLFLSSCVCYGMSTKKNTKNHSYKKGKKGAKQLSSKTLQTISVCLTWSPWLKGLVHWETCGKEKGKNSSSMSRWRWIQYVTLKPTCPVYWIVFFARTVWIISWRTINIIKNQKCQKWGTLNFIRVTMHYMKTFQLENFCWVSLTSHQIVMRTCMFTMKKGITVSLCLRG